MCSVVDVLCKMDRERTQVTIVPETTLSDLSKEQLVQRVTQLEAHVKQLKNIISKARGDSISNKERKERPFDFNKYNTRHVALKVVYLGWDYQGFVTQEDTDKTIEDAVFKALLRTKLIQSRETACYHRCGRTDKGVSAFGQVISLDLRTNLLEGTGVKVQEGGTANERPGDKTTEIRYVHILNKVLPPEIRVLAWCPVDPEFSARFSCKQRTYKYYFPRAHLDIQAMRDAAARLTGEHDFRNLCKMDVGNGVTNFTRRIDSATIEELVPEVAQMRGPYTMCEVTVVGQAFLWHQIRCILAVLFLVGHGKEKPQVIEELLDVESHPCKPQYTMASELPLVLFDCQFADIDWIYEQEFHVENIRHLQQMWTQHTVRSTMLRRMLEALDSAEVTSSSAAGDVRRQFSDISTPVTHQVECLLPGNKARVYKALWERPTCDSLEDRIEHYAKRRKVAGEGE